MNLAARKQFYEQIEKDRKSRVLALVTGERPGLQTHIAGDAIAPFVSLLDRIGPVPKLSLLLDTYGGQTAAAWRLINLVRSFCDELEIIIPTKAMSAGTLMSIGADRIVMTKQAALGPIDPSLSGHSLAPLVRNQMGEEVPVAVSAEAIRGYIDEVTKDLADPAGRAQVWMQLATMVHPVVLGEIFRLGGQIRSMAAKLISAQVKDEEKQKEIIQMLCSDSGSHDYTINRRQASEMGLNIEKPSAELYQKLTEINKSWNDELKTFEPFSPQVLLAGNQSVNYTLVRGLIESTEECFGFVSAGEMAINVVNGAPQLADMKSFEGWRKL